MRASATWCILMPSSSVLRTTAALLLASVSNVAGDVGVWLRLTALPTSLLRTTVATAAAQATPTNVSTKARQLVARPTPQQAPLDDDALTPCCLGRNNSVRLMAGVRGRATSSSRSSPGGGSSRSSSGGGSNRSRADGAGWMPIDVGWKPPLMRMYVLRV